MDGQSHVRLRSQMVTVGVWSSYVLILTELAWVIASWGQPNRGAMVALLACGLAGTAVLHGLDAERIVRGPHCESFFLAWSLGDIAVVGIVAALDGGATSPAVGGFFCTVVFAALSYPLRSVAIIGVLNVAAFLAAGTVSTSEGQAAEGAYLWMFAVCLGVVGAMCVWQARVQEERRRELARLSSADPLTGALNRRGFGDRLECALLAARRDGTEVALIVLDLDGLKALNDTRGHEAGDALLCTLVDGAKAAVRAGDAVGRLGGDEFAVLLPEADEAVATQVAERIAGALPDGVGVSYGLARRPHDGATAGELHRRADERLYADKRAHRVALSA